MKAYYNNQVIAESDQTILLEGNHYFPSEAVNHDFLVTSGHHTTCPWKGLASYYHVSVNGEVNENAAWVYQAPKPEAQKIKGYIAFWKGVIVK